ncbi:MAG: DNA polymerase III subunit alpha [Patescibacteria group bacterium]|nr:DNA polymerase III subunit alpha [Patescibacteria group bacterium]
MFVHLHNHTHYSLLDGLTKIDELVGRAKEEGSNAVAITDHGVLYGAIEFYQKCKKAGVKPIIGYEAYLAPASRHDKNTRADGRSYHLVLLAKNEVGYKNLIKLVSLAHLEGFYYKPRIDWELLTQHHDGLIALSACLGGEISQHILNGDLEKAKKRIREYSELFGPDNYYLEIMDHPELDGQEKVNKQLIAFSKELGVPLVATNDVHYFKPEDAEAQDILLCLQNKKKIDDTDRMRMIGHGDYSMRPASEMEKVFAHVPEAIANTVKIAEMCNLEIPLGEIQLPFFEVPEGHDGNSYLRFLCERGLEKKYALIKSGDSYVLKAGASLPGDLNLAKILERLDYELSIVAKMGWPAYFLIVADFVNWAKDNKIVVGPGRGSAAGSLVCYLTGITNLDPLHYDLLFERFLNPDRISMPDIDMDFADARRGDVLDYVGRKYGHDHVAQIITFGTMAARAAVRDVGRVLGAPYDYCDKISKSIPMFTSLSKALSEVPEVKEMYQNEPEAKRILDYAKRLEGVARHSSTHACGVLITPKPLTEYVPIQYASASDKSIISQYSLHPVEDLGLLKMDFLGLKNLTIIESALRIIKKTRGLEIDIDKLPLDDESAYRLFQQGETTGVFQFESSGMKRYLRELKPTEFEDIIAMVALYRPGPMEWIPDYISGKHGDKKVSYLHPKLEPILARTYGVAIYQEQVMQISRALAGFTPGEADVLRKAMGKKIPALLAEQKEKFIDGCVKNGIYKELAEKVFSFIEPFAGYGFNRSHAACYAMIGYQTAYLKAHWPVEFMAALLTSDQHDSDRVAIEIEECRSMGIKVMPPDINESFDSFTVVTAGTKENKTAAVNEKVDTIRFGLNAIKNVGEHIVEVIIAERKEHGPYQDIFDLLERVNDKDLNKKSLESLIKSGSLDSFGELGFLLSNLERLLLFNKENSKQQESRQASLFAAAPQFINLSRPQLLAAEPIASIDRLSWEKELLGLYISDNPLSMFAHYLSGFSLPLARLKHHRGDDYLVVAGVITALKKIITRKGESMLFAKIEDQSGSVELLIFPSLLKSTSSLWQDGGLIIARGRLSEKDSDVKILVDQAGSLSPASPQASIDEFKRALLTAKAENRWRKKNTGDWNKSQSQSAPTISPAPVRLDADFEPALRLAFKQAPDAGKQAALKELLARYPGNNQVYFRIPQGKQDNVLKIAATVDNSEELRRELRAALGSFAQVVEPESE